MEEMQSDRVAPGQLIQVVIAYTDEIERHEFVIVPDDQADFQAGFLGESTPLAQAILGKAVGEQISYNAGDARSVRIISISSTQKTPSKETAARREETIKKALAEVDRTNAMIFASSFSGKWGDYDPDAIEPPDQ